MNRQETETGAEHGAQSADEQSCDGRHYDVVILGGGLAGLSLARHLLLDSDKRVLLVERKAHLPQKNQKVGESTVQVAGYYISRVLDMEHHLFHHHFMKYNLRFYWRTPGTDAGDFANYSQSYIRNFSNIASYQLDRNVFEGELLRLNRENERFTIAQPTRGLEVDLEKDGEEPHRVRFQQNDEVREVTADWVVDTTGRGRFLARQESTLQENAVDHGAVFFWTEGLVDIDKLTQRSRTEIRLDPSRRALGHLPYWLATNHFMDEGLWFWVIPLQNKTSFGLVYDRRVVNFEDVSSVDKVLDWVCQRFPLFEEDLRQRKILHFSGYKDYSYGCTRTLSPQRWAMSGEAGRFPDPLYSPGSDFISIHNTLIVDAILTADPKERSDKCRLYEQLMRTLYDAYMPGYSISYDALGDHETMVLKYAWELSIYFALYVFPFINDLFTDRRFIISFLSRFARLGPANRGLQRFLSGYFQWKKGRPETAHSPRFVDFTEVPALERAAETFYEVGVSVERARQVLDEQVGHIQELARYTVAHAASVVLDDLGALTNKEFVEGLDPAEQEFDPEDLARRFQAAAGCTETYEWSFDPRALAVFQPAQREAEAMA